MAAVNNWHARIRPFLSFFYLTFSRNINLVSLWNLRFLATLWRKYNLFTWLLFKLNWKEYNKFLIRHRFWKQHIIIQLSSSWYFACYKLSLRFVVFLVIFAQFSSLPFSKLIVFHQNLYITLYLHHSKQMFKNGRKIQFSFRITKRFTP